jgi:WD40 repeat protein
VNDRPIDERRLRERLQSSEAPDASAAEERAWRVVSGAFEQRRSARPPGLRVRSRLGLALAALLTMGLIALSPAGAEVADWIGDAFDPGRKDARPALAALPAPGRLLVTSERGPWIVQGDGSKRRLGDYEDAGWSPRGLFVVATSGRQLVAVEPGGDPRWSLARNAPVQGPAWSPDGFRIAYLSGRTLRVVAGDGTGDRRLARRVAGLAPAWRPGKEHVLAFSDREGRIVTADADSGRRLSRSAPGPVPTSMAWTPDGRRLVAMARGAVRVLDERGDLLRRIATPPGAVNQAFALHPSGHSAALSRHFAGARRSEVVSERLAAGGRRGRLFTGDGRFSDLAWSPNGHWLLIGWREADQWLFLRSTAVKRIVAVSNISRQFDPAGDRDGAFPRVSGWCCVP